MNTSKNILILGSLSGTDQKKIGLYEALIRACKTVSPTFTIASPMGPPILAKDDKEKRKIVFQKIATSDLVIGDLTVESTAQGVEIGEAEKQDKPFIVTAEVGSRISGIVTASPVIKKIIFYENLEDVKRELVNALKVLEF